MSVPTMNRRRRRKVVSTGLRASEVSSETLDGVGSEVLELLGSGRGIDEEEEEEEEERGIDTDREKKSCEEHSR